MPVSKQIKVLSVRLPVAEVRRLKILAAGRGVTVQEAVHEAIEAWASQPPVKDCEPLDALQGSLADVDFEALFRAERETERAHERRSR
jgi:hypothetical protein